MHATNKIALVEVEEDQTNKVQTMNKFAVLEVEQSDINENNQLVLVGGKSAQNSIDIQLQKEPTAQWVNRTFAGGTLVATNRSCQEIPS